MSDRVCDYRDPICLWTDANAIMLASLDIHFTVYSGLIRSCRDPVKKIRSIPLWTDVQFLCAIENDYTDR